MADRELPLHSLSRAAFHEICAGAVGQDTVTALADAEHSRRRLLLRALADTSPVPGTLADPGPAWDALAAAEVRAPDIVRELILYPPFGVWLHRAITHSHGLGQSSGGDPGYLNTIAAAAAIRADVPCDLILPVRYGAIVLPTVGRLRLPTSFPAGTARLRRSAGETRVTALGERVSVDLDVTRADDLFRPAPVHAVVTRGVALAVSIDDTDPYREFSDTLPPCETGPIELLEWRKLLDETWDTLVRWHPGSAAELAAGLRTVTPASHNDSDSGFSSAAAIGSVVVPAGLSSTELAESFIHEFQHSKFNALSRLVRLTSTDATGRYYAPWREDPRPLPAMLHGLYAFVAVAEFWLAQGGHVPDDDRVTTIARFQLVRHRQQVARALASLADAGHDLTDRGAEFVVGVRQRVDACAREPVPAELSDIADRMIENHYAHWRLRNIRPDTDTVDALADGWRRGRPPVPLRPGTFVDRQSRPRQRPDRSELLRARITDPNEFARVLRAAQRSGDPIFHADADYAQDNYADALSRYRSVPHRTVDVLVGLGQCLRATGAHDEARVLLERPEIVAAVCARLDADVDPVAIAAWLTSVVATIRVGAP